MKHWGLILLQRKEKQKHKMLANCSNSCTHFDMHDHKVMIQKLPRTKGNKKMLEWRIVRI
jgi:hypothetical protein